MGNIDSTPNAKRNIKTDSTLLSCINKRADLITWMHNGELVYKLPKHVLKLFDTYDVFTMNGSQGVLDDVDNNVYSTTNNRLPAKDCTNLVNFIMNVDQTLEIDDILGMGCAADYLGLDEDIFKCMVGQYHGTVGAKNVFLCVAAKYPNGLDTVPMWIKEFCDSAVKEVKEVKEVYDVDMMDEMFQNVALLYTVTGTELAVEVLKDKSVYMRTNEKKIVDLILLDDKVSNECVTLFVDGMDKSMWSSRINNLELVRLNERNDYPIITSLIMIIDQSNVAFIKYITSKQIFSNTTVCVRFHCRLNCLSFQIADEVDHKLKLVAEVTYKMSLEDEERDAGLIDSMIDNKSVHTPFMLDIPQRDDWKQNVYLKIKVVECSVVE